MHLRQGGYRGALLRAALLMSSALIPSLAQAQSFQSLGFLSGGNNSTAASVSGDGLVVVGYGNSTVAPGTSEAFRWTPSGGMVGFGLLAGGTFSFANAVSGDGTVAVGMADSTAVPGGVAFRWTQGTGMVSLGTLTGGTFSFANAVSGDGTIVVGQSDSTAVPFGEAFRWTQATGMVGLGTLAGGDFSQAMGVSANGLVVVGQSTSTAVPGGEAFRWTGGVMTGLGVLAGGIGSGAQAVNSDGSVVVGWSGSAIGSQAFRWTQSTGMVGLGFLPGGDQSAAYGVSGDGSVVVGYSSAHFVFTAFRWTPSTGMKSIASLLTASGVNMTGWKLQAAYGVSTDGTVIVGDGTNPGGRTEAWLVRCGLIGNCAFITPGVISQSFSGQSAIGQTGNAAIGNTLGTLTQVATESGANQGGSSPYAVFAYGGYDSDPVASGSLGLTAKLADKMIAGAMVSANYLRTNMVYDGNTKMTGGAGGLFLARVPDAGLQWLVGVAGITLKSDITRGYLNGNSPASSQGNTTGNGVGAAARIGWTFDHVWRMTQVTPFASYTVSRMHFGGYTESGGPFPAQFDSFNDTAQIVRVGADARYTFAPGKWVWGTLASAHRLNSSKTDDISGTVIGLFGMTAPVAPVAKDWVEATAGERWQVWKNGAVNASVTASIPEKYATTYQVRLGVTQTF